MSNIKEITGLNFKEILASDKPIMLVFSAVWCGPCQSFAPLIEKIADEYKDTLIVGKVDIDNNFNTCNEYKVMAVPSILFIKDFKTVKQFTGVQTERTLEKIISELPQLQVVASYRFKDPIEG